MTACPPQRSDHGATVPHDFGVMKALIRSYSRIRALVKMFRCSAELFGEGEGLSRCEDVVPGLGVAELTREERCGSACRESAADGEYPVGRERCGVLCGACGGTVDVERERSG